MTLLRHLAAAIVLGLILVLLTIRLDPFRDYQMAEIACYVIAVAGLTVLVGLSGQISLGNGAFMAIGAYSAALLLLHLALAAGRGAAGQHRDHRGQRRGGRAWRRPGCAARTWPAPRCCWPWRCPRWRSATTACSAATRGSPWWPTRPRFLGASFPLTRWQAWLTCGCALITLVLLANLARSRVGRSWRAAGDDEVAAALAGLNVARLRVLAFVVSAACAGLGGALLARDHVDRLARRVHGHPVDRAAHRGRARRPGQPGRRGVGQPRAGPGAHLRDRRGHQPRPVQLGRVQHPGRRLRRRARRRHAPVPRRHPGRAGPAVPAGRRPGACPRWRGRARPDSSTPLSPAPAAQPRTSASEHQEEGSI